MIKLDENKLSKLTTFDAILDKKYGKEGSAERQEFDAKAKAWYFAELLKQ